MRLTSDLLIKRFFQYSEYILIALAITVGVAACVGYLGVYFGPKSDPAFHRSTEVVVPN